MDTSKCVRLPSKDPITLKCWAGIAGLLRVQLSFPAVTHSSFTKTDSNTKAHTNVQLKMLTKTIQRPHNIGGADFTSNLQQKSVLRQFFEVFEFKILGLCSNHCFVSSLPGALVGEVTHFVMSPRYNGGQRVIRSAVEYFWIFWLQ